jgi:hypothetical protein
MALSTLGLSRHCSLAITTLLGVCALACTSALPQTNGPVALADTQRVEADPARLTLKPIPLRAMTESERALEQALRQNVTLLLAAGERHAGNEWGLASATDMLAGELESKGMTVQREGFIGSGGGLAQNLVVNFPGSDLQNDVVIVGAQYDSAPGSPGADDNATGAAALLELAKAQTRRRTLRLVWFSDASGRTQPQFMGAWHHLELAAKPKPEDAPPVIGTEPKLCIDLHGLGAFSETLDGQTYAPGMPMGHRIAEFIEVLSLPQYMTRGKAVAEALGKLSSVPIKSVTTLGADTQGPMTPFEAFASHGCPAVLIHDTGSLRFADFGKAGDTLERIDFGRFARVVDALTRATEMWVNAPTLGDGL